jgi:DNA-binding CsgD family transcriptional regulator
VDNVFIKLVDRQGTVLWAGGYDYNAWEKPLMDYVDKEDKARVLGLFADVIIRGECVNFFTRWFSPILKKSGIWAHTRIMPVNNVHRIQAIAAVVTQVRLPENFGEFNDNDRQLLSMLADDCNVREVAAKLDRSESAIDMRIRALKAKLGANTLHGLVALGFRGNVISHPKPPLPA